MNVCFVASMVFKPTSSLSVRDGNADANGPGLPSASLGMLYFLVNCINLLPVDCILDW